MIFFLSCLTAKDGWKIRLQLSFSHALRSCQNFISFKLNLFECVCCALCRTAAAAGGRQARKTSETSRNAISFFFVRLCQNQMRVWCVLCLLVLLLPRIVRNDRRKKKWFSKGAHGSVKFNLCIASFVFEWAAAHCAMTFFLTMHHFWARDMIFLLCVLILYKDKNY